MNTKYFLLYHYALQHLICNKNEIKLSSEKEIQTFRGGIHSESYIQTAVSSNPLLLQVGSTDEQHWYHLEIFLFFFPGCTTQFAGS